MVFGTCLVIGTCQESCKAARIHLASWLLVNSILSTQARQGYITTQLEMYQKNRTKCLV